jgi:hypothetical protein
VFKITKNIEISCTSVAIGIFVLGFGFRAVDSSAQESSPTVVQTRTTETTAQATTVRGGVPVKIDIEFQKARLDASWANLLRSWGDVIAADPSVVHRIARSPALLRNQSFLEQHPALRDFVASHPDFPDQFTSNPGNFVVPN